MYHGISDEGLVVAQVAHVVGPEGRDDGWMVWLIHQQGELFDRYASEEEAMSAAEAALNDEDEDKDKHKDGDGYESE